MKILKETAHFSAGRVGEYLYILSAYAPNCLGKRKTVLPDDRFATIIPCFRHKVNFY